MKINVDFGSESPITNQIVEQIQQQLSSRKLKPGDQMPTVRALATELRINFNTVARAYRMLHEAGILSTQQGRGTYILDLPPPESAKKLRQEALKAMAQRYVSEAERLGFTSAQALAQLKKITGE